MIFSQMSSMIAAMPWRPRRPVFSTLKRLCFGAALLGLCGSYGLREDEVKCEQAASHFEECCGSRLGHSFDCYYTTGCHGTYVPDIPVDTASCLMGLSCADLQSAGHCDMATWPTPKAPSCP